jgi:hypothetical protein
MSRHRPHLYGQVDDKTSKGQESRVASQVGGKRQPGSGASDYAKGDVKQEKFLIECKMTQAGSIRVTGKWLSKISREAVAAGRKPALSIEIQGHDDPMMERDWVMVPKSVFKMLIDSQDQIEIKSSNEDDE